MNDGCKKISIFFVTKLIKQKKKTQRKREERATTPLGNKLLKHHSLIAQGDLLEEKNE